MMAGRTLPHRQKQAVQSMPPTARLGNRRHARLSPGTANKPVDKAGKTQNITAISDS
jgi:hypothetical protein